MRNNDFGNQNKIKEKYNHFIACFYLNTLKNKIKSVSYKPILHEELMEMIGWEILGSKYLRVLDS